jgi:hypothetical protein
LALSHSGHQNSVGILLITARARPTATDVDIGKLFVGQGPRCPVDANQIIDFDARGLCAATATAGTAGLIVNMSGIQPDSDPRCLLEERVDRRFVALGDCDVILVSVSRPAQSGSVGRKVVQT